jgi:hypothetical protein
VLRLPPFLRRSLVFAWLAVIPTVLGCDPEIHLGSLGPAGDDGGTSDGTSDASLDSTSEGEPEGDEAHAEASADQRESSVTDTNLPEAAPPRSDAGDAAVDVADARDSTLDASGSILWHSDFEVGNLSEWTSDGKGGISQSSAPQDPTIVTTPTHANSSRAAQFVISPQNGMVSANYVYRQPTPVEAYYSAWFYIPDAYSTTSYWNIMHFPVSTTGDDRALTDGWDLDLGTRSDGQLIAYIYQFGIPNFSTASRHDDGTAAPPVPTRQWVHFEVFFRIAADATGRVALWQDGALVIDVDGVPTAPTPFLRWAVGSAAIDITPSPATIYIDDAAISTSRLGP